MDAVRFVRLPACAGCVAILSLLTAANTCGQGISLNGVGTVNRSMAGAATAAPLEAMGAIHWNPATIAALPSSELAVGLELLLPTEELASRVGANALGPGVPPVPLAGSTIGEPGVTPIPNVGFVKQIADPPFAYGLGVLSVGGFSVNYPSSATNPILTPQPPFGIGLGQMSARAEILQLVPTLSAWLTDRLAIGFAPTVTLARVAVSPAFLAAPDDANADGFPTYGEGTGTRYHWGGGFQLGVYYTTETCWSVGASLKSPQWLESFRFHSKDELGLPVVRKFDFEYPTVISLGASYFGFEDTVLAVDVRYFDYGNADGFGDIGFRSDGAVAGLAWESVWSVSVGLQRRLSESFVIRAGYWFAENPVSVESAAFNVASPLINQHAVSVGASKQMGECWQLHLTYLHGFENSIAGPLQTPAGPIPDTEVRSTVSADALAAGISVQF